MKSKTIWLSLNGCYFLTCKKPKFETYGGIRNKDASILSDDVRKVLDLPELKMVQEIQLRLTPQGWEVVK